MPVLDRRTFLASAALAAGLGVLPPAIARALDIPAKRRTGTIADVEHVVILTQENRSFDHYFGTMRGVRGFSDRFAAPNGTGGTVFVQPDEHDPKKQIAPFRFDTTADFHAMRASGTPHTWSDAHAAWDHGRMANWPAAKHNHAMGHFTREDIPFQYALAEAFTICDAYHCAIHAGTDPNRLFLWTATVDAAGQHNGPVIYNAYDKIDSDEHGHGGYTWVTYPERLSAAGVTWQVYQNASDNFDDNPLVGFKLYRVADKADGGPLQELAARSLRTRDLDLLKADVLADTLPQVSWVVAPADYSEHPGPSSPAEGADYTARVLDALTANPEVWSRTVLLINFDENDGYFDHVPPPAPPSTLAGQTLGDSQVDTSGEYIADKDGVLKPSGLGPRVPLYVVSPWSKGGFVNSQVFDHTSVIRFLETRFGVYEPNITPWRRSVCGDLTSCFDFANPDGGAFHDLPATAEAAAKAKGYLLTTTPDAPDVLIMPEQEKGQRPARPLPYVIEANIVHGGRPFFDIELVNNSPDVAVVFQVYDLQHWPRRHAVAAGNRMKVAVVPQDGVQLAHIIGPNGFARVIGAKQALQVDVGMAGNVLNLTNGETSPLEITWTDMSYGAAAQRINLQPGESRTVTLDLSASHGWYDFSLTHDRFTHRFAGHVEDGRVSISDPALGGPAPAKPAWTV